jgi:putative DNA primase/helicase
MMNRLPQDNPKLRAALAYARLGWNIIPLHNIVSNGHCTCAAGAGCGTSAGKHPRIKDWVEAATTDTEQITAWWSQWPNANIGGAAGPKSGFLPVDVDGAIGRASLEGYELPFTPRSHSGRDDGGCHYFFKWPEGVDRLPNKAALLPGVDIRTEGGLVVLPPSRHYTGRLYKWEISPLDAPLAPCPQWVVDLAQPKKKEAAPPPPAQTQTTSDKTKKAYLDKVLNGACDKIRNAPQGQRHAVAFKQARLIGGYIEGEGLDPFEAERRLLEAAFSFADANKLERENVIADGIAEGRRAEVKIPPPPLKFNRPVKEKTMEIDPETGEILPDLDQQLVDFSFDDDGNARAFLLLHPDEFLYCKAYGWMNWNGKFWDMENGEFRLHNRVVEALKRRRIAAVNLEKEALVKATSASAARTKACMTMIMPYVDVTVDLFDKDPNTLNCNNGLVNLKTGKITPHSAEQKFTYCLSVDYDPKADYSLWTEFLAGVVAGGQEMIDYLQLALGYSFTGHTVEECLFYIWGLTRSGKGTFTETIRALLGKPLSTEVDFNTFTAKRDQDASNFDLAPLKPARVVLASESNRFQSLNPAKIKSLTGGNEVNCCYKHRDFFNYKPLFKVWLSSNWEVNADADDDALWGRLRVIHFPNSFLDREDKTLKRRMISPDNLQGVLRWAVEGAMKWYALPRGLETPNKVKEDTQAHRGLADFVQSWLEECTTVDATYWEPNAEIMESYSRWCKRNNIEPKGPKALATTLRAKGYLPSVTNFISGKTTRGVQGLKLNEV